MITASDLATWIAAITVPTGAAVTLLKWHVGRLDTNAETEQKRQDALREADQKRQDALRDAETKRQDELREELREDMQKRIDEMLKTIRLQGAVINGLMKHIRGLEVEMSKAGLPVPVLDVEEIVGRISHG